MYKIIGADQKEYGPVTADQLRQWVAEGRVNAQTLVQPEGQTGWQPLSSVPELASALPPTGTIPPAAAVPGMTAPTTADAGALVQGPATGLLIVGILCIIAAGIGIASSFTGFGRGNQPVPPQFQWLVDATSGMAGTIIGLFQMAVGILTVVASGKLKRLESYGLVTTATVLSMLPCTSSCCCVGLPIGIWVIIAINKLEVRSAFR